MSGMVMPLEVPLLYRIVLAILGFLFFHMKLIIIFQNLWKLCWDFDGDCTESIDCFSHYLQESPYAKYLNVVCESPMYREFPCSALLSGAVSENSESTGKPTNWCSFFCYTYDTRSKYLVVSEPLWCPSSSWSNWCCQEQLCLMSW